MLFILVEPMPGKHISFYVLNFKYSIWMNPFCHTVFCIYMQLIRRYCETHDIVII